MTQKNLVHSGADHACGRLALLALSFLFPVFPPRLSFFVVFDIICHKSVIVSSSKAREDGERCRCISAYQAVEYGARHVPIWVKCSHLDPGANTYQTNLRSQRWYLPGVQTIWFSDPETSRSWPSTWEWAVKYRQTDQTWAIKAESTCTRDTSTSRHTHVTRLILNLVSDREKKLGLILTESMSLKILLVGIRSIVDQSHPKGR